MKEAKCGSKKAKRTILPILISCQKIDGAPAVFSMMRHPGDGEPVRYDPDRHIFYSVGKDGIEHGGTLIPENSNSKEESDLVESIFAAGN